MSEQAKSTDEGVIVEDAQKEIEQIDSVEALELYAGAEAAAEDGRTGVQKAYKARKAELTDAEDPEDVSAEGVVTVSNETITELAEGVDARVQEDKNLHGSGHGYDRVDDDLFEAAENLNALADNDADEVDVPLPVMQEMVNAIALKANRDQAHRGMMQPSPGQRALIEAKDGIEKLDF